MYSAILYNEVHAITNKDIEKIQIIVKYSLSIFCSITVTCPKYCLAERINTPNILIPASGVVAKRIDIMHILRSDKLVSLLKYINGNIRKMEAIDI